MRSVQKVFPVTTVDGEFYLEPCKGFWSIVKPLNREVGNQIANPSFENKSTIFWHDEIEENNSTLSLSARFTTDQDAAYIGEYALRVEPNNIALPFGVEYSPVLFGDPATTFIRVPAKRTVYFSAWVKMRKNDMVQMEVIRDNIGPGSIPGLLLRNSDTIVGTGGWQKIKGSITNPATVDDFGGVRIKFYQDASNPAVGAFGLVDAVMATTDYELADYFDGDSDEASWFGTRYQSSSVLSRYARRNGQEVFLNDIGFNIVSFAGYSMPPFENDTIPYAQGGGSYHNRSWPGASRTITLVGQIESCRGLQRIQKTHSRLIELLGLYRYAIDQQDFLLRYRLTRCDCDVTGVLEIPVVYKSGLEGSTTNIASERITLQLDAYEDLFWSSTRLITRKLAANVPVEICYLGTAPTPMQLCVEGQTAGANNIDLTSVENDASDGGIFFQQAVGQPFVSVPAGTTLCVGDIDTICGSAFRTDNVTAVATNVTNTILRPASVPSQFILLNGENNITPTIGIPAPGVVPIVYITYRERFLSATDAWRIPRSPDCDKTFNPALFSDTCKDT